MPPGDGPTAASDSERDWGASVGRGPLVPIFFFFNMLVKKKKIESLRSEIGRETPGEVKTQKGDQSGWQDGT